MNKERVQDIAVRYRKKADNAFCTYQETGKAIYDWFYREYDDISTLACESMTAVDTAQQLVSLRVTFSEILDRIDRGDELEEIKKYMMVYARLWGLRR